MQQMSLLRPIGKLLSVWVLVAMAGANPAMAQSVEELDRLVRASEKRDDGEELVRSQIAAGSLLEALATLDRMLAEKPKNKQARLLRASTLCQLDDRVGASVEFARLKEKAYSKTQWAAAMAPCIENGAVRGARQ